jgi:hypothetical protein
MPPKLDRERRLGPGCGMRRFLLGLAAAAALAAPAAAAPDLAAMSPAELTAFLHAFPKGGELHNHLGGGTPAETLIGWAVEDGLCVDMAELAIRAGCSGQGFEPAAKVVADEARRSALIDSLTVRHAGSATARATTSSSAPSPAAPCCPNAPATRWPRRSTAWPGRTPTTPS